MEYALVKKKTLPQEKSLKQGRDLKTITRWAGGVGWGVAPSPQHHNPIILKSGMEGKKLQDIKTDQCYQQVIF